MFRKLSVTACVLTFGLIVPILEINDTHLFNPLWPAHARLHEAWQLMTNGALAATCLWLVWLQQRVRLASVIGLIVTGGFLAAYATRVAYGGSMLHTDGTELRALGANAAVLVMGAASALLTLMLFVPANARSGTR